MELNEALEVVVSHTRHERFRDLTDPSHPDYNPGYVTTVMTIAAGMAGEEPPAPAPSLLDKAMSFGKAVVTHAVAGFPEADEATVASRLAACRGCEFATKEPLACGKCGCHMEIKARWAEQVCPIGKW